MSNQRILWNVVLADHHKPTGKTTHWQDGKKIRSITQLQIAQIGADPGYYLLYLDETGNELTDTHHETEEKAMRQAEFEFCVRRGDWKTVKN